MSKLSKGQRKIARIAMPFDKITGAEERKRGKKMARPEMGTYWN